jgi:Domain of unknown function (DUF6285)
MSMRGVPTTAELVAAVREFLTEDVMPATEGRLSFHARVAANVLAQVERELRDGPLQTLADAELAAAIRDGTISYEEAVPRVRASVVAKLRITNPRHLLPEDR